MQATQSERGRQRPEIVAKSAGVKRNRSGRITRDKILDAAEDVFAAKGVHGASLREIMLAANVNIAAVNYYFGSKPELLRAVVARRAIDVNGRRLALLDAAIRKGDGVAALDDWLAAYVVPVMEAEGSSDPGWRNFVRVLNWVATARDAVCLQIEQEVYNDTKTAFIGSLAAALPEVSREDIHWRYHCVVGVVRWCLSARDRAAALSEGIVNPGDLDRMLAYVKPFLISGLNAPATRIRPPFN